VIHNDVISQFLSAGDMTLSQSLGQESILKLVIVDKIHAKSD